MRTLVSGIALAAAAALAACDRQPNLVAPRFDLSADYDCANPLSPPSRFQVLASRTSGGLDTLPMMTNRYLEPHRWKDTILSPGTNGQMFRFVVTYTDPANCVTLADSVVHRMDGHFAGFLTYP